MSPCTRGTRGSGLGRHRQSEAVVVVAEVERDDGDLSRDELAHDPGADAPVGAGDEDARCGRAWPSAGTVPEGSARRRSRSWDLRTDRGLRAHTANSGRAARRVGSTSSGGQATLEGDSVSTPGKSFDPASVSRATWIAAGGALVLFISVFLSWYSVSLKGFSAWCERQHERLELGRCREARRTARTDRDRGARDRAVRPDRHAAVAGLADRDRLRRPRVPLVLLKMVSQPGGGGVSTSAWRTASSSR